LLNTIIEDSSPSVRKGWTSLGRRTMTYEELIARLPDELQPEIKAATNAATKSAFDAYYAPLIDRKRQELQDLELEHQQALEDVERWVRGESGSDESLEVPHVQESATPTRREMVLDILPDFSDQGFIRREVEAKIIERWPEAEPKTEPERKNFTSAIAALMTKLANEGRLNVKKGESRFDPRVYTLRDT
jgi:hypothetical protein